MEGRRWRIISLLFVCASLAGCVTMGATPTPTSEATIVTSPSETLTPLPKPTATLLPPATAMPTTPPPTVAASSTPSPVTATATSRPPTATPSSTPCPTPSPVAPAEWPPYDDRSGPTTLLASYANAINRGEYARAWGYWESPPNPSYEDFVQGFADTAFVRLAVRPPTWFEGAAGSSYAQVATLLSATHADGSQHNFIGCYVSRRSNVQQSGDEPTWSLYDASLQPTPRNASDALLLAEACQSGPLVPYDDRSGAVAMLASYVNAINLREYGRAWAYWETPPEQSLEAFAQGFAETESVLLVVRPPTRFEGAAGSTYVAIPTLLSALHNDGTRHNFTGCYVARRPNLGGPGIEKVWSIYDATVDRAPGNSTDVTLLDGACAAW